MIYGGIIDHKDILLNQINVLGLLYMAGFLARVNVK